jgi:hypothetical protein
VFNLDRSFLTEAMDDSTAGFHSAKVLWNATVADSRATTCSSRYCPERVIAERHSDDDSFLGSETDLDLFTDLLHEILDQQLHIRLHNTKLLLMASKMLMLFWCGVGLTKSISIVNDPMKSLGKGRVEAEQEHS